MASIRIWKAIEGHPKGGVMYQTLRSTKIPLTEPRSKAKQYADTLERIGRKGGPNGAMRTDKAFFEEQVAALMHAAGVEAHRKDAAWSEFSEKWLSESDAGPSSMKKYRGEITQFSKFLGARSRHSIREISFEDCKVFHAKLIAEGRASGTARNTLKTIRAVLEKARALGFIDQNPAAPSVLKLKSGRSKMPRKPFSRKESADIFAYLDSNDLKQWRTACFFGLYYGMRIGDAVSRRLEEIGNEDGIPVIRFVPQKKQRSGGEVVLPLVGELADLKPGNGFITPRLMRYAQPSKPFALVLEKAGIKISRAKAKGKGRATGDKGFHSFRHTINSRLADAGVDLRLRQLICDHDDIEVSMKYTHGSLQKMADAIRKAA